MITLHIENTVHDFEAWKAVFDKFDRFRADHGMRRYRMTRPAGDLHEVLVDLDFDSMDEAVTFQVALEKIWATPQSQEQLVSHATPRLYEVVEERTPAGVS